MDEKRVGMLIDTSKCIGCRSCQVACKQWHGLEAEKTQFFAGEGYQNPPTLSKNTFTLVTFKEQTVNGEFRWLFRKHQCMHCTDATCINVCPTKAIIVHPMGFIQIQPTKCISCYHCVNVCPFNIPKMNDDWKPTFCTFCQDRVVNGLAPACAKTCPTGAIRFGMRSELLIMAKERVEKIGGKANLYGETQCGGLTMLYVLADVPSVYGLPENPVVSEQGEWELWGGILKWIGI